MIRPRSLGLTALRQLNRPVNDDLFAQRRRDELSQPGERREGDLLHGLPQRVEEQLLADQRHTAADDDLLADEGSYVH